MTKYLNTLKFVAILTLLPTATLLTPQAFAADMQWSAETVDVSYIAKERKFYRKNQDGEMDVLAYTSGDRASSVEFVCFQDQLYAAVITNNSEPSFPEVLTQESSGYRTVPRSIKFGDKKRSSEYFLPSQSEGTYMVFKKRMVNKFYNAAVKGEKIRFNSDSRNGATVKMPLPNRAFADFAKSCGMIK